MSLFGYNESEAQDYTPLTKEQALEQKLNWSDYEAPLPKVDKTIPTEKMSVLDDIKDVPDEIVNWAIECEVSKKLFRIIPKELKFYREHGLPISRRHPDVRHLDRLKLRNPRKLWHQVCDKKGCEVEFETTYAPDRPEKVYCEKCYREEVYG